MFVYQLIVELCGFSAPLSFDLFAPPARNLRKALIPADAKRDIPKDFRLSKIIVEWIDLEKRRKPAMKPQRSPSKNSPLKNPPAAEQPLQINFLSGNTEVTSGIIHFFRSEKVLAEDDVELSTLCIPAVPPHMTASDLLEFFALFQESIVSLRLLRDAMPGRLIVLLKMEDPKKAKEFHLQYNRRPFNLMEPDICDVLFVENVQFKTGEEIKTHAIDFGLIELPTCPVCLERLDSSASGVFSLSCNHTFHCNCLSRWTDSSCPVCRFGNTEKGDTSNECLVCGETESLWMCLVCGHIGCGRYNQGHAFQHFQETHHPYAIELGTQRVWDYVGDGYVHRLICNKTDGKMVELPAAEETREAGNRTTESFSKDKVEAVAMEYNMLLTTQLESQRNYYQDLLNQKEEEIQRGLEAVKKEKLQIQKEKNEILAEIDNFVKDKKATEKKLQQLIAKQVQLAKELAEEKALCDALRSNQEKLKQGETDKDTRIRDLEDQVKDLMFYMDTQSKVEASGLKEEIQGGQIVMQEKEKKPSGSGGRRKR